VLSSGNAVRPIPEKRESGKAQAGPRTPAVRIRDPSGAAAGERMAAVAPCSQVPTIGAKSCTRYPGFTYAPSARCRVALAPGLSSKCLRTPYVQEVATRVNGGTNVAGGAWREGTLRAVQRATLRPFSRGDATGPRLRLKGRLPGETGVTGRPMVGVSSGVFRTAGENVRIHP
jgi:hypothetical protein